MSRQFEFRLKGANAPTGQLEAGHLLAIVQSIQEVASKIARAGTDAQPVGRAPKRVRQVATMMIGLAEGSTRVLARRAGLGDGSFDVDLSEEAAFDETFAQAVGTIALDERPEWVDNSLAIALGGLTDALQHAAREVAFAVDGVTTTSFKTADVHAETWRPILPVSAAPVTFVGRLIAANIKTRRLVIEDDVGHQVGLPGVNDDRVGRLLGRHVAATGAPEYTSSGEIANLHGVSLVDAPDPADTTRTAIDVPLDDILRSASGPDLDGGIDLTDEEFASFLEAARG